MLQSTWRLLLSQRDHGNAGAVSASSAQRVDLIFLHVQSSKMRTGGKRNAGDQPIFVHVFLLVGSQRLPVRYVDQRVGDWVVDPLDLGRLEEKRLWANNQGTFLGGLHGAGVH